MTTGAVKFEEMAGRAEVSAAEIMTALRESAEGGARISSQSVIETIARTVLDEGDVLHLMKSAVIGRSLLEERAKINTSWTMDAVQYARICVFLQAWGHEPPTAPMTKEHERHFDHGRRYIAVFDQPRLSCRPDGNEGTGMILYASRNSEGGLLLCDGPHVRGVGWGVEAFRALIDADNRHPLPPGLMEADDEAAPAPSP